MTTVPMADTIGADAKNIPASFAKVAGYDTGAGSIPWTQANWAEFPQAGHVHIDQSPGLAHYAAGTSDIADVESGAGTITAFVAGTKSRITRGQTGHLYCSFGEPNSQKGVFYDAVKALLDAGVDIRKVDFWLARWDLNQAQASSFIGAHTLAVAGHGNITVNVSAVQWASPSSNPHTILPGSSLTLQQANVDLSETAPAWFPFVPPPVVTTETGVLVTHDNHVYTMVSKDSGKTWTVVHQLG